MRRERDITALIHAWRDGEPDAESRLFDVVYRDLRGAAVRRLSGERAEHTLTPTGLVHEAYLRLTAHRVPDLADRTHFFAVASRAMREVLIDYARRRGRAKRGGGAALVDLDDRVVAVEDRADELVALDEALQLLTRINARLSRVVECRYFAGLTEAETADVLGVTERTVRRDWVRAKGWLHEAMTR